MPKHQLIQTFSRDLLPLRRVLAAWKIDVGWCPEQLLFRNCRTRTRVCSSTSRRFIGDKAGHSDFRLRLSSFTTFKCSSVLCIDDPTVWALRSDHSIKFIVRYSLYIIQAFHRPL